jgi:segregation and condensation protein A
MNFVELFDPAEGRIGITVTFLAVLELLKGSLIDVIQAEPYGPIHVRAAQASQPGEAAAGEVAGEPGGQG